MTSRLLTSWKEMVLELLFPIKCVVCEKETGEKRKNRLICTDCLKRLSPSTAFYCPLCEAKTADGKMCFSCNLIIGNTENKFYLDRLFYPFSYKDPAIQKTIKAFKYKFIEGLKIPLGKLMNDYLSRIEPKINGDAGFKKYILVPVPLHKRKFNFRGYNQTELIASEISKYLNIETSGDCLAKIKMTRDQVSLKENRRPDNLKNAFACSKPWLVSGRKILLIDDVYTTGATMAECARVLKEAGGREIVGLVVARG